MTEPVVGYERKTIASQERIELVPLDLPAVRPSRPRRSGSARSPRSSSTSTRCRSCSATLHAAEHALIAMLPLWAMCDRWDIGGLSTNLHPDTGRPTVFVYDGHPGGVGITERGFEQFEGWVADTAAMVAGLPVPRRLPVVRPEPEVRQPERHARQGGSARPPRADAPGGLTRPARRPNPFRKSAICIFACTRYPGVRCASQVPDGRRLRRRPRGPVRERAGDRSQRQDVRGAPEEDRLDRHGDRPEREMPSVGLHAGAAQGREDGDRRAPPGKPTVSIKITSVGWPVYPDHTPKSKYINAQALPLLQFETLKLQAIRPATDMPVISGATQRPGPRGAPHFRLRS